MSKPDTLERLFGSAPRVRLMRVFVMNPGEVYDNKVLASRIGVKPALFSRELRLLADVGFIKKTSKTIPQEQLKDHKIKKKKIEGWGLDKTFPYLNEFTQLLSSRTPQARDQLVAHARKIGKVNLLAITGAILGEPRRHVDVFFVGDGFKKTEIEKLLKSIEIEMGKELVYATMATEEFKYRYGMFDRFLRDLFDNPHEILLDKIGIQE